MVVPAVSLVLPVGILFFAWIVALSGLAVVGTVGLVRVSVLVRVSGTVGTVGLVRVSVLVRVSGTVGTVPA